MRRTHTPTLIIAVILFQFCASKTIKIPDSSPKQVIYKSHYFQITDKSDKRIYKDHAAASEILFTVPELQLVLSGSTVILEKPYPDDKWISVEWIEVVPIEQESEKGSYIKHDGWMRIAGLKHEAEMQKEFAPFCDEIAARGRRDFKSKKLEQSGDDGGTWMEPASLNFWEEPFIMQISQTYQVETFLFAKLLAHQPGKSATILAFTKDLPRYGRDTKPIKLKFSFHQKGFHLTAETHRQLVGIPDKYTVSKDFPDQKGVNCRGPVKD